MKLKAYMNKKISKAKTSRVLKLIMSKIPKKSGVYKLALINVVCTTLLGVVITYSLYHTIGIESALSTVVFTAAIVGVILAALINIKLNTKFGRNVLKVLLPLAILFSLPFGVLSLPLLQKIETGK